MEEIMKKLLIGLTAFCVLANAAENNNNNVTPFGKSIAVQTFAAIKIAQKHSGNNNLDAINTNLIHAKNNFGSFYKAHQTALNAAAKKHADEISLQRYKKDVEKTCFDTQKRIQTTTKAYQAKLNNEKQKFTDLSLSKDYVDVGHAESARNAQERAFDDFNGFNVTRLFNTLDFQNVNLYKQDTLDAKNLVEDLIYIGRADLALEYAKKMEDIKDFSFFAPIKKSSLRNKVLSSFNKKDRAHLQPMMDQFKQDLRKKYDNEQKEIIKDVPGKHIGDIYPKQKDWENNFNSFADSYDASIMCQPFVGPDIDNVKSFQKSYVPRITETLKTQKQITPQDDVFRFTYDKFNNFYLYCKELIAKKK
jgi:hypothetical protein